MNTPEQRAANIATAKRIINDCEEMKGALARCGMLAVESGNAELCRDYLQLVGDEPSKKIDEKEMARAESVKFWLDENYHQLVRRRVVLPSDDVAKILVEYLEQCGIAYSPPQQEWEAT